MHPVSGETISALHLCFLSFSKMWFQKSFVHSKVKLETTAAGGWDECEVAELGKCVLES